MTNTLYKKLIDGSQEEMTPSVCIYLTLENNGLILWRELEGNGPEILHWYGLARQYEAIKQAVKLGEGPSANVLNQSLCQHNH